MGRVLDQLCNAVIQEALRGRGRLVTGNEPPAEVKPTPVDVVVTLPAAWEWQRHPVTDEDLPEVTQALDRYLQERCTHNARYAEACGRVTVRRARPGEPAWAGRKPRIEAGGLAVEDVVAREPTTARFAVSVGSSIVRLGDGCSLGMIRVGPGRLHVLVDGGLVAVPERVALRVDGRIHRSAALLGVGPFTVHGVGWLGRWGPAGRKLADGEVTDLAPAASSSPSERTTCRIWGAGLDVALDADHPVTELTHDDAGIELRLEAARGMLALRSLRARPILGRTRLGRGWLRIDRELDAQLLPGEIDEVDVAGRTISLSLSGTQTARVRRKVTAAPPSSAALSLFSDRILVADPAVRDLIHVGELLQRDGVRALFCPLVDCRVDGRVAHIGDILPVNPGFSLQFRSHDLRIEA